MHVSSSLSSTRARAGSLGALVLIFTFSCASKSDQAPVSSGDTGASADSESDVAIADAPDSIAQNDAPPADDSPAEAAHGDAPPEGAVVDTWANYAKGFFKTYCVECHATTSATRNYTTIADVKRDAAHIRCGLSPTKLAGCSEAARLFPISHAAGTNPKPTDSDRNRLLAWLAAGLKE
ncbi:MAG: hypothetical protein NVSMB1_10600 [Polyangiales bacterium]